MIQGWAREMTHPLRLHTTLPGNLSLNPSIHMGWLKTTSVYTARGAKTSSGLTGIHTGMAHTCGTHTHTQKGE